MNNILKISCIMVMGIFLLAACGGEGSDSKTDAGSTTEQTADTAPPVEAADATATIKGEVLYTGKAPRMRRIKMDADPVCVEANPDKVYDQSIVLSDNGGLENVFVYVKVGFEGQTFPMPTEPVVFDQSSCTYSPHVFGIRAKQNLEILNSDATLHNVHATPKKSSEFNVGMPTKGMKITKKFKNAEIMVHIKCEVHPWMNAYCGVLDHPYFAVAGSGGTFELPMLPAGTYTIEAWHEKLGTQTQEVTVGDGETQEITFEFSAS